LVVINLQALRHTIASAPTDKPAAGVVSMDWLKEVERDLTELAALRQRTERNAHA
jgi:hypothetical protein